MSNVQFPSFPGLTYTTHKTPTWNTAESRTPTGKSITIARQAMPTWNFTLVFSVLSRRQKYPYAGMVPVSQALVDQANLISNDFNALAGFFNARKGKWDTWLFEDPRDCAIVQIQIGTADGIVQAFQIGRQMGEFFENIQNVNGTPVSAPDWAATTAHLVNDLILPTPQAIRNQEGPIFRGWQSTGWPAYYKCTIAGSTGAQEPNWRQVAPQTGQTLVDGGVTWTCQGPPLAVYFSTGAGPLTVQSTALYTLGSTGILTFTAPPAAGTKIWVTCAFWFRCKFLQDTSDFELLMTNFYGLSKLEFESKII